MLFMFFIMMVMVLLCCAAPFASATWLLMLDLHNIPSYVCERAQRNSAIVTTYIHSICMYLRTYVSTTGRVHANASNICTSTIDCTYDCDS